jgi:hypothetical protein
LDFGLSKYTKIIRLLNFFGTQLRAEGAEIFCILTLKIPQNDPFSNIVWYAAVRRRRGKFLDFDSQNTTK